MDLNGDFKLNGSNGGIGSHFHSAEGSPESDSNPECFFDAQEQSNKEFSVSSPVKFSLGGVGDDGVDTLPELLRNCAQITSVNYPSPQRNPRSVQECVDIYRREGVAKSLTDDEIISLVEGKHIAAYQLEKAVGNMERGVSIR